MMIHGSFLLIGSFLLGAVPFGQVISRFKAGVDLRAAGSGNIGATNVARVLGTRLGVLTLILDAAKGGVAVLAARFLVAEWPGPDGLTAAAILPPLSGLAALLGHVFSPFLRFRGGKGVATALGICLVLVPLAVIPALTIFILVVARWRYVSLGSLTATLSVPFSAHLLGYPRAVVVLAVVVVAVVFLRHRENIGRLIGGRENKWSGKTAPRTPSA